MIKEELIQVRTEDDCLIAVWKIYSNESVPTQNIFLTHGTFSNKSVLNRVAKFLAAYQYTCWIMEWRDHGDSLGNNKAFNFETIAIYDLPAVFKYLYEKEKISDLTCLTHSGGGIILTMFLINHKSYISKINCIVLFACQAFAAAYHRKNYLLMLLGKYLTAVIGKVPASFAGARAHDEQYYTMKQWFDWNLNKNFQGKDGVDYLKDMSHLNMPILSICAKGDQYIAPKYACEAFLQAYQNEHSELDYYAKANGNLEDYNHSKILNSKNAQIEIWPKVLDWIAQHSKRQKV